MTATAGGLNELDSLLPEYEMDARGLSRTKLTELLIRESWVRIPPGPPRSNM